LAEDDWSTFSDPSFAFEFDYPLIDLDGRQVDFDRRSHPFGEAVHISTTDARTIYFELSRGASPSATGALAFLKRDVATRFDDAWFGDALQTTIVGVPALTIRFHFGDRWRWATFTDGLDPSYRVILDPRSSTNLQILGTMRLRSEGAA
jgi:hypothetical protein